MNKVAFQLESQKGSYLSFSPIDEAIIASSPRLDSVNTEDKGDAINELSVWTIIGTGILIFNGTSKELLKLHFIFHII